MKKILAINYSQTGQLTKIVQSVLSTMTDDYYSIEHIVFEPKKKFLFPWQQASFFDAMPETVLNEGVEIEDLFFKESKYDLIIIGYQPWFLSMSLPTSGLFKSKKFTDLLFGTPVISIIGARNMWINAQNDFRKELERYGGKLVANIPLIDKNLNLISAVTIQHWMFRGRKDKKWGVFPKPGVSDIDISNASKFGPLISNALINNSFEVLQYQIVNEGSFQIKWDILFIESRAKRLFKIWANLIKTKGLTPSKRKRWLVYYRIYLTFALFILSPIILTIYFILFRVFFLKKEKFKTNMIINLK